MVKGALVPLRKSIPDLTFKRMPHGTHQTPWDLRILLYKGGAAKNRKRVGALIDSGRLGSPLLQRLPFVSGLHEAIATDIAKGLSINSVVAELQPLWKFTRWADDCAAPLTLDSAEATFIQWTEALLHRVRIVKDLEPGAAYQFALAVAGVVARALGYPQKYPGKVLLKKTRIRAKHRGRGGKQNLDKAFQFGHFLADVCLGLDSKAVRGSLPVVFQLRNGTEVLLPCGIKDPNCDPDKITNPAKRERALLARQALGAGKNPIDDSRRSSMLNLRIEAELLIFVAQTSMNLAQAAKLPREGLHWQSIGEEMKAYRVYKRRRGGPAIFVKFKEYRRHHEKYLKWLADVGLAEDSDRMFPFIPNKMVQAPHAYRSSSAIRRLAKDHHIACVGAREFRKTRQNWLFRRSGDLNQTAAQGAHSNETLLKEYLEPNHQIAAVELIRYHTATDPTFTPPGDGVCVHAGRSPKAIPNIPVEAPVPDCISPDGCIFCIYHRDVMTFDYCWRLVSHAKLKMLELALYKPSDDNLVHPANRFIDRVNAKLAAIANGSEIRAQWIRDAKDKVRAGKYHPLWGGHIELVEIYL